MSTAKVEAGPVPVSQSAASLALHLMHPQYVLRVAGESASKLAATWNGNSDAAWKRILAMRELSASLSAAVCDQLAHIISTIPEAEIADRRRVLDLRRALHNGRPGKAAGVEALRRHAAAAECERIIALHETNVACEAASKELAQIVDQEMSECAQSMRLLLESRNLQLALSYNNHTLLARLNRYYREGVPADSKTTRNLEDSLLQFFCRASTKTSPLSSLTLMRVGHWNAEQGASASRLSGQVERRIETKAALMRHILHSWLRNYKIASKAFPLTLNPTMHSADGKIQVHMVAPGKDFIGRIWGTALDMSSFDANPMLACVQRAMASAQVGSLWAAELVERICALAPKLLQPAVEAFVEKLYGIGYLSADTGLLDQVDLLQWAQQTAAALDPAIAADFQVALARLRANLDVMGGDNVESRMAASADVDPSVFALATAAGAYVGGYLYRTPFYENCYYTGDDTDMSPDLIAPHRDEFDLIQQINRIMDANHLVHTSLCDYFVSQFGEEGVCVDIHRFIEQFDKVYAPLVSEGRTDAEGVAQHSPRTLALMRARRTFEQYFQQKLEQGRDAQLDHEALRGIVALLPDSMRARNVSYSYLVQPFTQDGQDCLVLNQVYGGRSGILSRFCEVLNADGMEKLRAYLKQGSEAGRNAELGGVFGFNANRHPAMSDSELVIPPFAASYPHTRKISLKDLRLVYVPDEHRLEFLDQDDQPIDIWYHGLLTPVMLPAVQRTIALAFSEGPCFFVARAMESSASASDSDAVYSPRLTLGKVVISRRSWTLAYSTLPDASMSLSSFYPAIREWQAAHGLPDRFFVRALLDGSSERTRMSRYSAMKEINFKDLKPFFVDLRNPRLVRLFQNMLKRHQLTLLISEVLPEFDAHSSHVDDEPRVSEMHFELTTSAPRSATPELHWYALRVAYFGERGPLLLGPVAKALETARQESGVKRAFFVPHWKFGPHVDLVVQCDAESYALRVLPAMQTILEDWIAQHPSTAKLDPKQYEQTSQWVGTMEIDSGPYLPLLEDNSVAPVPYVRAQTLLIKEVAESKEFMLSDCSELILAMYRLKDVDREAFFLTLHAMLVVTADTPDLGVKAAYMSMRSHADYFFAGYDTDNALRKHFDSVDAKNRTRLDQITRAVEAGNFADTGLPAPFVEILASWASIQADIDARSRAIVALRYDELINQNDSFMAMATQMRQDVPDEYFERFDKRQMSDVGEAFINTRTGKMALQTPEFLAYRINVNFFYALLPLLEVAPIQKFLLCHLLSNSVERVFDQDWRKKVARVYEREEALK